MAGQPRKKADDQLLLALACGATVEAAARQCRLNERTVYRRLADAGFQQRLRQVRTDMVQRTAATLTAAGSEALRTLLDLLKPAAPAAIRLGAARVILELGTKLRESADLEVRLAVLEQQMATSTG
jgi:hypothetical protein